MNDQLCSGFIIALPSSRFEWFYRIFALIFGIRFVWAAFAREKPSAVETNREKRAGSPRHIGWRIVQFFLAVALFLVALGVLK